MIHPAIYSILSTESEITDLVDDRISPHVLDQDTEYPAINYSVIDQTPYEHNGSASSSFSIDIQVECWADTLLEVIDLSNKVRFALDNYSGIVANISISKIRFLSQSEDFEPDISDFRIILEFNVFCTEGF